jgi:hypothetical protein
MSELVTSRSRLLFIDQYNVEDKACLDYPQPLSLTKERQQLQQIINRHSTAQQIAMRAQIILLAAQAQSSRHCQSVEN